MRRVYAHLIAVLFLASCSSQTSTPPRVVKFDDVLDRIEHNVTECEIQQLETSIFYQKDQIVSVNNVFCDEKEKITRLISLPGTSGDTIAYVTQKQFSGIGTNGFPKKSSKIVGVPLFSISKLGTQTPENYLKKFVAKSNQKCILEQINQYSWRYDRKHQCDIGRNKYFVFKGGLVLQIEISCLKYCPIDFQSITYTNKG